MSFPIIQRPTLPPNTIVPENRDFFISYFNRIYEDIAFAVNAKDYTFFPGTITGTAANIPNIPNFGSYILCISGVESGLPCITASLCKNSATAVGVVNLIGSQAGSAGVWSGATLTISATTTNFQIRHSVAGTSGNFNFRIIGTQ